jgi:hypothetical protein
MASDLPIVIGPANGKYTVKFDEPMTKNVLIDNWMRFQIKDRRGRDALLDEMHRQGVRPDLWLRERDKKLGIYPDISDPDFAARLTQKTEFAMLASDAPSDSVCTNTCVDTSDGRRVPAPQKATDDVFDTTPVQRLVARFLHPTTPYRGLLLNHGVGVGKTCSAVTVAEMFLDYWPNRTVFILAPQAIAEGFRRTIFDVNKLVPTTRDEFALTGERWKSPQCTGMTYLRLTSMEAETNKEVIETAVRKAINARYKIMGYLAFAKMMQHKFNEAPKPIQEDKARFDDYKKKKIISMFNDHLIIVDEAHNLRDEKEAMDLKDDIDVEDPTAVSDSEAGKQLTPILKQIVVTAEGLRLMLMTATPMYNKATEILFLLRLLLANDANDANVFENQLRVENVFNLRKRGARAAEPLEIDAEEADVAEDAMDAMDAMEVDDDFAEDAEDGDAAEDTDEDAEDDEDSDDDVDAAEDEDAEDAKETDENTNDESIQDVSDIDDFGGALTKQGRKELIAAMKRYVSYMRGENPNTFPLRLTPPSAIVHMKPDFMTKDIYPRYSISKKEGHVRLNPVEIQITKALPIVVSQTDTTTHVGAYMYNTLRHYNKTRNTGAQKGGAKGDTTVLYKSTQIGNITYNSKRGIYGNAGWNMCFKSSTKAIGETNVTQFSWNRPDFSQESVFQTNLRSHSPKIAAIVESVNTCVGLSFIFSQFVGGGALPIAAALEMNGWCRVLHDGTPAPLLTSTKPGKDTKYYILLTSAKGLAPEFPKLLRYASQLTCDSAYGPPIKGGVGKVQAIIGSQITSEGLDLKCIRQLHVLDGWYHLNRIEQIVGRGVRFCSHSLLPSEERNCTIYLHALAIPKYETADLYAYRLAVKKARYVGEVSRLMKIHAWDCMLNMNAILLPSQGERTIRDSAGKSLTLDVKDTNYSSLCDYDTCPTPDNWCPAPPKGAELNTSTYRDFDYRRQFAERQKFLAALFSNNVAHPLTYIRDMVYKDIPWSIGAIGLREALNTLRIKRNDGVYGTLVLKNGYVLFQPDGVTEYDTLPAALRYGRAFGHLQRLFKPEFGLVTPSLPPPLPAAPPSAVVAPAADTAAAAVEEEPRADLVSVRDGDTAALYTTAVTLITKWKALIQTMIMTPTGIVRNDVRSIPEKGMLALRWIVSWMSSLSLPKIQDDIHHIACVWFIDNLLSNDECIALYSTLLQKREDGVAMTDDERYILGLIQRDLTPPGKGIPGFFVYNVKAKAVQSYCFSKSKHTLALCDSSAEAILAKSFPIVNRGETKKPAGGRKKAALVDDEPMDADVSNFFGILVQIKNDLTFKLVNRLQGGSATGTVCKTPSGLTTHRERLRKLYAQIPASSPMKPYLFTDLSDVKGIDVLDGEREDIQKALLNQYKPGGPRSETNITDIAHLIVVQVCIYMDFLLRWLDMKETDGKRWFLRLTETARSGIPME